MTTATESTEYVPIDLIAAGATPTAPARRPTTMGQRLLLQVAIFAALLPVVAVGCCWAGTR